MRAGGSLADVKGAERELGREVGDGSPCTTRNPLIMPKNAPLSQEEFEYPEKIKQSRYKNI